ncbi:SDR family oxidoreductase [Natronosporangium hydrolyticum]|uniref:SDR family oxidoreductase n=1 Tax=Natronosporangium hydrolyticum TaxID=2811111 RepID=A0A895YIN8_9ACTN|nr:SDR family oxidoreductase [Natronosporangium hydrolyticum]QSB15233.1 SDR family oxidoreductase [Natronosporangium hydrolyticum]
MSKTIMITGSSRGIGLATAARFLAADNDIGSLVLVARESARFTEAIDYLEQSNHLKKQLRPYPVDLGDRAQIVGMIKDLVYRHGSIDILVNNAGFTAPAALHQTSFADFERTIGINLYAPFTIVQELLHAGNQAELIVNIASTAGMTGRPGWLTYSSSKAALIAMTEVMREELAIHGTRVVCISPGRCATDLRRTLAPEEDPHTIMQPEDVAAVLEMLASDVGRYVDSQNLVVRM